MFLVVKQSGKLAGIVWATIVIINILFDGYEL
jgi:hypothetical protein